MSFSAPKIDEITTSDGEDVDALTAGVSRASDVGAVGVIMLPISLKGFESTLPMAVAALRFRLTSSLVLLSFKVSDPLLVLVSSEARKIFNSSSLPSFQEVTMRLSEASGLRYGEGIEESN